MKKGSWLYALVLSIFMPAVNGESIVIASDSWCPINCKPGSAKEGFMIDIAKQVFQQAGYQVDYINIPWARALQMARAGQINAVVGAYDNDAPGFIFPKNEQASLAVAIYVRKDTHWQYEGLSTLENMLIGVAEGYSYGEELDRYIETNKNNGLRIQFNYGQTPVKNNIQMLLSNKIDAIVATPAVFSSISQQLNIGNKIKFAGNIHKPKKLYVAFSPALAVSPKYAKVLSDGMDKLRETKELNKIMAKYGLTDWQ